MRKSAVFAALAAALCLQPSWGAEIRRFALIVGSNAGGAGTEDLRYAASDARAFSAVLLSFGGLAEEDQQLLTNPGRAMLSSAFDSMRRRMDAARKSEARTEFIFYYSGHSDDEGLLLAGERYGYEELRDRIVAMASEVRLVVLDSCSSGAITRFKGGARSAPFLVDTANLTEGQAFLTSSTAAEASQESDAIRSSFFSHSLVNALRGAADRDGDGKVSLNEAYQYSYEDTLSRTEKGAREAQHPAFDIRLTGTGNLILTDLRNRTSRLILPQGVQGRIAIRDMADKLVVEMQKTRGRSMDIGLEPGAYALTITDGEETWQMEFTVRNMGALDLDEKALRKVGKGAATGKGPVAADARGPSGNFLEFFPVGISFPRALDLGLLTITDHAMPGLQFGFLANWESRHDVGFQLSLGITPIPLGFNFCGGNVAAGQVAFLGNWAAADVTGVQISGLGNVAGGSMNGFQFAVGGNVAVEPMTGLQLAGGFNVGVEEVGGVQAAILNVAVKDVGVGQIGGLNIAAGRYGAFQVGGMNISPLGQGLFQASFFGNVSAGEANGAQVSLGWIPGLAQLFSHGVGWYWSWWGYALPYILTCGFNVAGGDIRVGQVAGLANICAAAVTGVQLAGGVNYAARLTGLQLALVNVSPEFTGAQVGLINIALRGRGTQVGILNVSGALDGVPVGLLDIQGNGENHFDLWTGSTEALQDAAALTARLDFRFGSRWFHKYLGISFSVDDSRKAAGQPFAAAGMGLGLRVPMLDNQFALIADAGAELCAFSSNVVFDYTELFADHLVPVCRALAELRVHGIPVGVLFGVQGRVFVEGFNSKYFVPAGNEATVSVFGTVIRVQPRLFAGLSL